MNIIIGASGRVGRAIVDRLLKQHYPVKAIVRDEKAAAILQAKGAVTAIADVTNEAALKTAFADGTTLFILTPETGITEQLIPDTAKVLQNYRTAIEFSTITKIVGLSSMGAQHETGTGNLMMSYLLEHAFTKVSAIRIFIRPAAYYSNWLQSIDLIKEKGILPTFYPPDLAFPMISPGDVGIIAADIIASEDNFSKIYEIDGPNIYSSNEVAEAFSTVLGKEVKAVQVPRDEWEATAKQWGFTEDMIKNFVDMTEAVIDGKADPEGNHCNLKGVTTLEQYLKENIQ